MNTISPTPAEICKTLCSTYDLSVSASITVSQFDTTDLAYYRVLEQVDDQKNPVFVGLIQLDHPLYQKLINEKTDQHALIEIIDKNQDIDLVNTDEVRRITWLAGKLVAKDLYNDIKLCDQIFSLDPHTALCEIGVDYGMIHLELSTVVLSTCSGAWHIDPKDLITAKPNPFRHEERFWITHINFDHPDVLERLHSFLPEKYQSGFTKIFSLDQYGVTLKVEFDHDSNNDRYVRLSFSKVAFDEAAFHHNFQSLLRNQPRSINTNETLSFVA